jgi:hypothetical protein
MCVCVCKCGIYAFVSSHGDRGTHRNFGTVPCILAATASNRLRFRGFALGLRLSAFALGAKE